MTVGPQVAAGDELAVEVAGERLGTVWYLRLGAGTVAMSWALAAPVRGDAAVGPVLSAGLHHAFTTLGAQRVETRIDADDARVQRAAGRAGLRREGLLRSVGRAQVLMARLVDDPPVGSPEAFVAMLNAGLPKKRVISQGILRDEHDRVLLCELTYKQQWDLPGGVIETGEAPSVGLVREVREELGLDVELHGLRTVNWLPPWNQWDDACVFVFDLGQVPAATAAAMRLQPTEIAAVHWCDPALVAERGTAATTVLLEGLRVGEAAYREAGVPAVTTPSR